MLNFILNFVKNNFVLVLALTTLIVMFAYHFKCIKKIVLFGVSFITFYIITSQLTIYGIINDKLYNLIASTIYYVLYYLDFYTNMLLVAKDFVFIRGINMCQMLLISNLINTIFSTRNFFTCIVLLFSYAKIYEREILQLFKKIETGIKTFILENKINTFNKIVLNC